MKLIKRMFNNLFSRNIDKKEDVKEQEPIINVVKEYKLDIDSIINQSGRIVINDVPSYISGSYTDLLNNNNSDLENISEKLNKLIATESEWINIYNTAEFFSKIKRYSYIDISKIFVDYKDGVITEDSFDHYKRCITASGILFEFLIPDSAYLMDDLTTDIICRYTIMTVRMRVNLEESTVTSRPYSRSKGFNLDESVKYLLNHVVFNVYFNKTSNQRFPNAVTLLKEILEYNSVVGFKTANMTGFNFNQINYTEFNKTLTCIFVLLDVDIPRDYVYLDIEVIDWLENN